jgi:euchromatic histone-lysine N-methyltransferase
MENSQDESDKDSEANIKRRSTIRSLNTELASSPSSSNPNKSVEEIMMMFDSLR